MKKRLRVLLILLIVAGLTTAALWRYQQQQQQARVFTGTVEVTKTDITAKINGYISDWTLQEGSFVQAGQLVARLDRKDLTAAGKRDQAALEKAKAQLADLEKGARPAEKKEAAANTAAAQAEFDQAQKDLTRQSALYAASAISRQQLDTSQSAYDTAEAHLRAASEREALLLAGNREDVIAAAREEVTRARAAADITSIEAGDSEIKSPLSGYVLTKNIENGEYAAAGTPLATIADLQDAWIRIYIPSTELGRYKIGDAARIRTDAFPDQVFSGKIREIRDSAEYTPRQSITPRERANMVFAVKISVDNAQEVFKPGMPADVTFDD
mgnify:CR=1 FL=1